MSVQTILLDFSIDAGRISDDVARKELVQLMEKSLTEYFPKIKLLFETTTSDGHLVLFAENQMVFLNVRLFSHGIITVNIEYFKGENEQQLLSFDVSKSGSRSFIVCETNSILINVRYVRTGNWHLKL